MNAPVIMSSPHFYQNPDILREEFDGMGAPNAEEHETRLYIEPTTGMTIKLHKRIQVRLVYAWLAIDQCLDLVVDRSCPFWISLT